MKVLILTGSAKRKGTSALLAEEYQRGAEEVGHLVEIFRAGTGNVHGCTGCNHCEYGKNSCVFRDDMDELNPKLLEADVIVIASPIYYWGIPSQLKAVIDRWQPTVFSMQHNKKAFFMTTQANGEQWVADPLDAWYDNLLKFMDWKDAGRIHALGCAARSNIEASDYPQMAYEAGKNI